MASAVCMVISFTYGAATHFANTPDLYTYNEGTKWNIIALVIHTPATAPIRASICVLSLYAVRLGESTVEYFMTLYFFPSLALSLPSSYTAIFANQCLLYGPRKKDVN
jgi:hypothetical protein